MSVNLENENDQILDSNITDFSNLVKEFVDDLIRTFPDIITKSSNTDLYKITDPNADLSEKNQIITDLFKHCKEFYPKQFFNILYQNDNIFNNEVSVNLLPGIDFKVLWNNEISNNTKTTIWKYLQLILFSIISNVESNDVFGDTAKLFEAINQDSFKEKIEETIANISKIFNEDNTDRENKVPESDGAAAGSDGPTAGSEGAADNVSDTDNIKGQQFIPDADELNKHMQEIMEGKIGSLAKEIADEAANNLNIDANNVDSINDVFKELMKEPTKIMDLVKNVGTKLDAKLKSGDINESELLEEASNMVNKIKDMPGMNNIQNMFSKMGVPGMGKGAKVDLNAFQKNMEQKISSARTRERMRGKYEASQKVNPNPTANPTMNPTANPMSNPMSNPMMNQMMNQMSNQMSNPMMNQMMNQMSNPMMNQMMNQMSNPMMNQMMNQMSNPMSNPLMNPPMESGNIPNLSLSTPTINNNAKLEEILEERVFKDGEPYEKTSRVVNKKKKKGKGKKRNK